MKNTFDSTVVVLKSGQIRPSNSLTLKKSITGELTLSKARKMTKSDTQSRVSRQTNSQTSTNVVKINTRTYKRVEMIPKSVCQEDYIELLNDESKSIVFATGPAGTGKTMLAVLAAIKAYKEGSIDKIIITRPAVGADDEKHGFLPGDLTQKMLPWVAPIMDIIKEYYSTQEITSMLESEAIELAPLAFLRGRTFKNAFIIGDEMQNTSVNQMKMMLTRIGDNSRMVITGDLNQHDKQFVKENGLKDFLQRLSKSNTEIMGLVQFTGKDIQRHPAVKEVLTMYDEI